MYITVQTSHLYLSSTFPCHVFKSHKGVQVLQSLKFICSIITVYHGLQLIIYFNQLTFVSLLSHCQMDNTAVAQCFDHEWHSSAFPSWVFKTLVPVQTTAFLSLPVSLFVRWVDAWLSCWCALAAKLSKRAAADQDFTVQQPKQRDWL